MPAKAADTATLALDAARDAIVVFDAAGRVGGLNTAAEELFGRPRAGTAGHPASELIVEPVLAPATDLGAVLGRPMAGRVRSADGTELAVELTVVELPGTPALWSAFVRQPDDRPDGDGPGRPGLLAAAQDLAQVGSWHYDLRTRHATWSPGMARVLGVEPGLRDGRLEAILAFVHPADYDRLAATLRTAMDDPEAIPDEGMTTEFRIVRPDGAVRELRSQKLVERDRDGHPVRFVGAVQDVTAERLTERELQAHYAVSQALRQWSSVDEGVMDLLRRLGTALHYPMGSLWRWDDEAEGLVCRAFWHAPEFDPLGFERAKRRMVFKPGAGKPGVAWKTGEPVVTPDAAADPIFQPRAAAIDRGIRSGLAFPAMGPGGPVAVVSFYSFERRVPSSSFVRTLSAIGRELGRFLEPRRSQLGPQTLSKREIQVMRLAASGRTGPQIAEDLVVSPSTIKTHFEHIYEKLGVSDRAAAVALALRTGVIH
jgi:PAS domain S-box-containing protein